MINMEEALEISLPHFKAEFPIFVLSLIAFRILTKLSNYKHLETFHLHSISIFDLSYFKHF